MGNERFTQKAELALNNSLDCAEKLGASYIGTEHILLSLIETKGSIASKILCDMGVNVKQYRETIESFQGISKRTKLTVKNITPRARCVLDNSYKNAQKYGSFRIGTEHILLSILEDKDAVASKILLLIGIDIVILMDKARQKLREYEKTFGRLEEGEQKQKVDLPILSKYGKVMNESGKIPPWDIVGRDEIIERVIRTLSRKTKNNPVLIGEAGVGKTAIIEGLAQKMASGQVPSSLSDCILVSLDLTKIVAGTKYRGDFEDRIRQILDEAKKNPKVILFIDELHTVIGAGAAEGAVDFANIMKPELARAEIRLIGATTHDEYRKNIEKDSALERRFQPIQVEEPSIQDTYVIMRAIVPSFEKHHGVKIDDSAITSSVELSTRYMFLRSRPDKCIDLLDEACAYVSLKGRMESGGYPCVMRKDLVAVLEEFCGIRELFLNVPKTEENIFQFLVNECIGQEKAAHEIANGILRSQSGIQDPSKPLGSYFFYGESGVGKTKMAKSLAKLLFGSEDRCITFDMSEYSEPHTISKLIGAPQGYVGYGEGGLLTQEIQKQPYSVLLFDEIEKAHRDIYHIFLQILEEGKLTDSSGKIINFRNTFIIFTSNLLAKQSSPLLGFMDDNLKNRRMQMDELKKHFPGEFIARIDSYIEFNPLTRDNLNTISAKELNLLKERLKKGNVYLNYDENLIEYLSESAQTARLGARPIKTKIRGELESKIAEYILNHSFEEVSLFVKVEDSEIRVTEDVILTL